ncbi:MAG: hypothetical protein BMS9Abin03_264 [Thermodesulfobacteriota bacterium]|nr:MAG: hypothetical protein BMS9Abin03_264 [Thermodesulfobacteriota bacterium]
MPRKARIDAPGALHHVIVRGIERRKIFRSDYDRQNFLDRDGELILPYRDHKQHIRLYVKRLGEGLSVNWHNLHKIEPLVESNDNTFFAVLLTFQESR